MYRFENVDYGPTKVSVEAATLRESLDLVGHLYSLHEDALFLAAHVRFFHDVEPVVVPKSKTDDEGWTYRGFRCLRTGCNITFKEQEGEALVFPGRYAAYRNGDQKPKLYDPVYDWKQILEMVGSDTDFVQRFRVDIGQNGNRQQQRRQGPPPQQQRQQRQPQEPAQQQSPAQTQSGSMPSTGAQTKENLPLPATQGAEILKKGWQSFVEVPDAAASTLASWDDSFAEIDDPDELREAIIATENTIVNWTNYQYVANTMLQYHRERLVRMEKESMVNGNGDSAIDEEEKSFEPDDELPF